MTRLQSHKNKQFLYHTFVFVALSIAVLVFLVTFGFKLIIGASLFVNQIANGSKTSNPLSKKENLLNSLTIDMPPNATRSAQVIFTGSTLGYDSLEIYLNDEKIKDMTITGDSFSEEVGPLFKGNNSVYFIAKSKQSTETKKSPVYTVIYKSDKPKLEMTEPQDGANVSKQDLKVAGKTDKETYIHINGQPVVVDVQGGFQTMVKLNEGDNKIEVIAEDIVGNTETKLLTVRYSKDE